MKKKALGALMALYGAIVLAADVRADIPKIILDTDMYTDFDDVGAMAVLHSLADAGECEILATVVSTRNAPSTGMVELLNAHYGRKDLPIGAPHGEGIGPAVNRDVTNSPSYRIYAETVSAHRELRHPTGDSAPDASETYRRVLAAAPDKSVTIVTVGFLTNLRRLLESRADAISPLDGRELVARKVKDWYAVACKHPDGWEFNSGKDAVSSKFVLSEWPTAAYFVDLEFGIPVRCGVPAMRSGAPDNPVRVVFARALREYGEVESGHAAHDEICVLAAVRGWQRHFGVERGRFEIIDTEKGLNHWTKDPLGQHRLLTEKTPKAKLAKILDSLIARGPR